MPVSEGVVEMYEKFPAPPSPYILTGGGYCNCHYNYATLPLQHTYKYKNIILRYSTLITLYYSSHTTPH